MRILTTSDPVMEADGDLKTLGDLGAEYTLPKASANTLGGIKVGDNLTIEEDGTLNADAQGYTLPAATAETLGGIKVGDNLTIEEDGTLNAEGYTLPAATAETLGGVKIGNGVSVAEDGTISVDGGGGGSAEVLTLTPANNVVTDNSGYNRGFTNLCLKIGDYVVCDINGYFTGLTATKNYNVAFTLPEGYTFTGNGTRTTMDSNSIVYGAVDNLLTTPAHSCCLLSDNRIRIFCNNESPCFSAKFIARVTYTEV